MENPNTLFFAFLLIPIIFCYFRNIRKKKVLVADLIIWEEVSQTSRKNLSFTQIKNIISLLLNSSFLLIIVSVTAKPALLKRSDHIIIIDNSPSTGAGKRLEEIKAVAKEILMKSIPNGSQACIITSGGEYSPMTSNLIQLNNFIDSVKISFNYHKLSTVTEFTRTLHKSIIYFVTDGQDKTIENEKNVFTCPKELDNVGIVEAKIIDDSIWFKIKNYSTRSIEIEIPQLQVKETMNPKSSKEFIGKKADTIEIVAADDFKEDNFFSITNISMQKLRPILVHNGNPNQFLKKTLNLISTDSLEVLVSKLGEVFDQLKDNSVFIFDHCVPAFPHSQRNCVYIGALDSTVTQPKNIQFSNLVIPDSVQLPQINVKKASVFNDGVPLIQSDAGPIAVLLNDKSVLLGFNLDDSDFVINPSFPLFFKGLIKLFYNDQNEKPYGFLNEEESDISTKLFRDSKIKEISFLERIPLFTIALLFGILLLTLDWLIVG